MSGHPFPPNFGNTNQNEMRSQFGGPQRGPMTGISSPSQSSGIAGPQVYNAGVNMQPPADSPISTQQLQPLNQPTPQQIQLHMQQRQQQQAAQQQQENPQQNQQTSTGQQNPQQSLQPQQSSIPHQTGLPSHQQVSVPPGSQSINTRIGAGDGSIQLVSQSSVAASGAVAASGVTGPTQQQTPANPQYYTASLCTCGQEMVQEIVSKLQEIFNILQTIPPPTGIASVTIRSREAKGKLIECLRTVEVLFKQLRVIYNKVNDSSQLQGMEYMHIESLIPLKEEWDVKTSEERKTSEVYRLAFEERKELIDQVVVKNAQLKEIIDRLRRIIWEINTMLMMRKS